MRRLDQFSAREWLQLLPLQHAAKQARNDVWLAAYQRRRPPGLDGFLAAIGGLRGKPMALVIAFEQPWALDWLLRMAERHLEDTTVLVFDNSRRPEARLAIEGVCRERGTPYLPLPMNSTRHVNRSHGMAMSWVYRNVVRAIEPGLFAFLDHDLIPVEPMALAQRLGTQPFFGMPVRSAWAWQLWAGYCMFDYRRVAPLQLNFLYDFSQGLDTGGRNWSPLYRGHDEHRLRFASSRSVAVPDPAGGEPTLTQIVDERWLHIGGISYNQNFRSKSEFCERLAEAFDQGRTWQDISGSMPAAPAGSSRPSA